MKIAFLGSRGIPARYSGFETFYEQLAVRLARRGHAVTVYNRSHFIKDVKGAYQGVRLVTLPSIPTKHLDTITHTLLSALHALTQRYDIAYFSIVGNSPLVWIARLAGAKTLLNVDGEDGAREKWGAFARWYQFRCERIATCTADVLISDAHGVQQRYRQVYGADTIFVPYGANVQRTAEQDVLARWGLQPRRYVLYVGRLVPENAIDQLIEAFRGLATDMKLVIVGDAPFMDAYKKRLHALGRSDARVVFTGYAFGRDYQQLSSHAYLYVQPSGVDGTRPALLDQMGFGNCVLVRNSLVNMEVIGDCGAFFDRQTPVTSLRDVLTRLLAHPEEVAGYRARVCSRIERYYNWDWVTLFYEDLFGRILRRQPLISYDEFLAGRPPAVSVPDGTSPLPASQAAFGVDSSAETAAPAVGMDLTTRQLPRVNVLGVGVNALDLDGAVQVLLQAAQTDRPGYVCVTGVHGVIEAVHDEGLREIHNRSLLTVPDGMPNVWKGQEEGFDHMGRVYGPDLMLRLIAATSEKSGGKILTTEHTEYTEEDEERRILATDEHGLTRMGEVNAKAQRTAPFDSAGSTSSPQAGSTPLTTGQGREEEAEKQESEVRGPGSEIRGQEDEARGPRAEGNEATSQKWKVESEKSGVLATDTTLRSKPSLRSTSQHGGTRKGTALTTEYTDEHGNQEPKLPLSGMYKKNALSHFFYGATPEVLDKLVVNLKSRFPGLQVAGTYAPPFRPLTEEEWPAVIARVVSSGASFVWVGLSTPKQERFMAEFCRRMAAQAPGARGPVLLGVGAAFAIHAGLVKDAPDWMKQAGLQWVFRLAQEPSRLWRRYVRIVPLFLWLILLQLLGLKKYELRSLGPICLLRQGFGGQKSEIRGPLRSMIFCG
ncbi:MAG: WecB/TagA/CpsF family glycosyltransferase [Kiritimatiellaeota bacterium]|nr:WecB/TagA/CpsF family glycosyltransferase [Kiritimatiellota bacterium]